MNKQAWENQTWAAYEAAVNNFGFDSEEARHFRAQYLKLKGN